MIIPDNVMEVAKSIDSYLHIPTESDFLIRAAERARHGIIEVGSWTGRSSVLLAAVAREKKIPFLAVDTWISCDLHSGVDYYPAWRANMIRAGLIDENFSLYPDDGLYSARVDTSEVYKGNVVNVMRMPSVAAGRLFEHFQFDHTNPEWDFVFIDADHSYESVKGDYETWITNLTYGDFGPDPGAVVLHDIGGHPGVRKLFRELRASGLRTEALDNIGMVMLGGDHGQQ